MLPYSLAKNHQLKILSMFTDTDKQQIEKRGMTVAQVEHQLEQIKNGFPFLRLKSTAAVGQGISALSDAEQQDAEKAQKYI